MISNEDFKLIGIYGEKTRESVNEYVTGKSSSTKNLQSVKLRINKVEKLRHEYPFYFAKLKYGVSRMKSDQDKKNILIQELNSILGMVNLKGTVTLDLENKTIKIEK